MISLEDWKSEFFADLDAVSALAPDPGLPPYPLMILALPDGAANVSLNVANSLAYPATEIAKMHQLALVASPVGVREALLLAQEMARFGLTCLRWESVAGGASTQAFARDALGDVWRAQIRGTARGCRVMVTDPDGVRYQARPRRSEAINQVGAALATHGLESHP
jgi:hypothetical protein